MCFTSTRSYMRTKFPRERLFTKAVLNYERRDLEISDYCESLGNLCSIFCMGIRNLWPSTSSMYRSRLISALSQVTLINWEKDRAVWRGFLDERLRLDPPRDKFGSRFVFAWTFSSRSAKESHDELFFLFVIAFWERELTLWDKEPAIWVIQWSARRAFFDIRFLLKPRYFFLFLVFEIDLVDNIGLDNC